MKTISINYFACIFLFFFTTSFAQVAFPPEENWKEIEEMTTKAKRELRVLIGEFEEESEHKEKLLVVIADIEKREHSENKDYIQAIEDLKRMLSHWNIKSEIIYKKNIERIKENKVPYVFTWNRGLNKTLQSEVVNFDAYFKEEKGYFPNYDGVEGQIKIRVTLTDEEAKDRIRERIKKDLTTMNWRVWEAARLRRRHFHKKISMLIFKYEIEKRYSSIPKHALINKIKTMLAQVGATLRLMRRRFANLPGPEFDNIEKIMQEKYSSLPANFYRNQEKWKLGLEFECLESTKEELIRLHKKYLKDF